MGMRDLFTAILRADARGMLAELKDVQQQVAHTADRVRTGFGNIRESVAGGVTSFVNARPAIGGALNAIGIDSAKAGSAIGTALPGAAAAGAAALGAFAAKAVASTMQLDAGILAVQRATGATAQNASALVAIADDFGLGADQVADSLGKLAKNADSKVLAEFGVQLAKNSDGTTDLYGTLVNLSDVFTTIQDPTERARLANAAFGKSWQNLLPILEQGRAGLEGAYKEIGDGQIRTQEQIDASEELRLTFDALSDAAGGLSIAVGTALIPEIERLASAALTVKKALDDVPRGVRDLGTSALRSLNPLNLFADSIEATNKFVDEMTDRLGLADDATDKMTTSTDTLGVALGRTGVAAANANAKAIKDVEKADRDAEIAAKNVAKANDDAARAMHERSMVAVDLASSMDSVERSEGRVTDAILGMIDAKNRQIEVAENEKATIEQTIASNRGVEESVYRVRDSLRDSATAAGEFARKQAEAAGQTFTDRDKIQAMVDQLEALRRKFPDLGGEIDSYVARLNAIPRMVVTDILARTGSGPQNVGAGMMSTMATASTGNIIINLPPGTDGEDVIAAQTRWQRRNGVTF
jgi:hypothetical protein